MTADPIKEALYRLPYGFYSITSRNGDEVNALILKEGDAHTTLTLPDLKWNYAG